VPGTLFEWMGWSFLNLISLVAWKCIPLSISKTVHGHATLFLRSIWEWPHMAVTSESFLITKRSQHG
jgi:hypothetical protein